LANLLTRKLEGFAPLSGADKDLLDEVILPSRSFGPREDIIHEGEGPAKVHLVLEGFACRYKLLPDGSRQIVSYFVPGDLCSFNSFILRTADHSISTLSPCRIVEIEPDTITRMLERPALTRALWWSSLVDDAVLREWLVNIGKRSAEERLAHLLCEIHLRLKAVGLAKSDGFEFPLTQSEIADTMGLSVVHVNRVLQSLRAQGLLDLRGRQVAIPDPARLCQLGQFNPGYLHLREGTV
jgi:CRP-like cAMP-binding protein